MSHSDGWIIATIAFAFTAIAIGLAGAGIAWAQIQEERHGTGRRGAGCRRSRCGQGCKRTPTAERVGVDSITRRT